MGRHIDMIRKKYKETKRSSLMVYLILRFLVILCMVLQILRGDWNNAFLCLLSLTLFTLPTFIQVKFKIKLPNVLEAMIYVFIFSAEILGEINNFYGIIPHWDTLLHTINGFLAAGIGFSLVDLLNKNSKSISLSPVFVAIVAFCFSMTIGVIWEFFEYGVDTYLKYDMQKDRVINTFSTVILDETNSNKAILVNNIKETQIHTANEIVTIEGGYLDVGIKDTMKDLFVNFIGAVAYSFIGFLYIVNRDKYQFATHFIVQKEDENEKE